MSLKKIKDPTKTLSCCFEWFKTFKIVENGDVKCENIYDVLVPNNLILFIQELSPMFFADYQLTDEHSSEISKGLHFIMDGINDYLDGRFREEIDILDYDLIATTVEKNGKVQTDMLAEVCRMCGIVIVFAVESEYNEDVISNMMLLNEDTQLELQHMIQMTGEFGENEDFPDEEQIIEDETSKKSRDDTIGLSLAHADEMERKIELLEKQLRSEQKARQIAEDSLKKVSAKPKSAIEETEKLENEVWNLQNEKTSLQKEKKELETKLKGEIKDLQSELELYKTEASKVDGLEQQIKKWKEKVDSLLDVKRQNEKLIKQLEETEESGTVAEEGGKKSSQILKNKISDLEEELGKCEKERDEYYDEISKMKKQEDKYKKEIFNKKEQISVLIRILDESGVSILGKVDDELINGVNDSSNDYPEPGTDKFYLTQLSILNEQLRTQKQLLLSEQKRIQLLESQGVINSSNDTGDGSTISTLKQQIIIREQEAELHLSARKEVEKKAQLELKLLSTCLHEMALKYHQCKSIIKQLDEELSALKQKCQISINNSSDYNNKSNTNIYDNDYQEVSNNKSRQTENITVISNDIN
ncbi:hypothetical protein FG386_002824 [Cryptosporidium ryanae]|uniref:uncharacterized protein n=1 Tax=Cryptosporidium ryanae TaxID=515981 RepID=UPI00351A804D|nr:hypothetical protein FG386_002824 [Cryptosporidium ryanae]